MINPKLLEARSQVRAYCWDRGLNGVHTRTCLRQLEVLLANGNTREFAQFQAERMADRLAVAQAVT